MEKSKIKSKDDNKEIRSVLLNSFEIRARELKKCNKEINQLRKNLGLEAD